MKKALSLILGLVLVMTSISVTAYSDTLNAPMSAETISQLHEMGFTDENITNLDQEMLDRIGDTEGVQQLGVTTKYFKNTVGQDGNVEQVEITKEQFDTDADTMSQQRLSGIAAIDDNQPRTYNSSITLTLAKYVGQLPSTGVTVPYITAKADFSTLGCTFTELVGSDTVAVAHSPAAVTNQDSPFMELNPRHYGYLGTVQQGYARYTDLVRQSGGVYRNYFRNPLDNTSVNSYDTVDFYGYIYYSAYLPSTYAGFVGVDAEF